MWKNQVEDESMKVGLVWRKIFISHFEKTSVKVLQGLALANSLVLTEFEDSEESPRGAFLHWCCCDVGSETSRDDYIYIHIDIPLAFQSAIRQIYINYLLRLMWLLLWCLRKHLVIIWPMRI